MSGDFDLLTLIRTVRNDLGTDDRQLIANAVCLRIAPHEREAALMEALIRLARPRGGPSSPPVHERLIARSERVGDCMIWRGGLDTKGYGRISVCDHYERVHRASYRHFVGPIPDGLQLDHLCHTRDDSCPGGPACIHRACWTPEHLEPVTASENSRRGKPGLRRYNPGGWRGSVGDPLTH
jgi:hypothetical protein